MEELYNEYIENITKLKFKFRRDFIDTIEWSEQLIFILGARGVGKTSLILQHIQETYGLSKKALYISLDDLSLANYSLLEIAKYHIQRGGTHLFIDEIHKYANWSLELKNIRDKIKDLKVVASGSSILEINKGQADLSRRSVVYTLPGLSFREFLNIELKLSLKSYELNDILGNHTEIAAEINQKLKPFQHFEDYLKFGYFPFYLENKKTYLSKLGNTVQLILESDLALTERLDLAKVQKTRKLIYLLTESGPFQLNISKLAAAVELDRASVLNILNALHRSSILYLGHAEGRFYGQLTKPEKIYLGNSNFLYLSKRNIDKGTLRETFIVNQLTQKHQLTIASKGDFIIDETHTIEVGGQNKKYTQIKDVRNSYLAVDDIEIGLNNKIPIWLFGFLY